MTAGTLVVTVIVPDIADWPLRYRVLEAVQQFEDAHNVTARCPFQRPSRRFASQFHG